MAEDRQYRLVLMGHRLRQWRHSASGWAWHLERDASGKPRSITFPSNGSHSQLVISQVYRISGDVDQGVKKEHDFGTMWNEVAIPINVRTGFLMVCEGNSDTTLFFSVKWRHPRLLISWPRYFKCVWAKQHLSALMSRPKSLRWETTPLRCCALNAFMICDTNEDVEASPVVQVLENMLGVVCATVNSL